MDDFCHKDLLKLKQNSESIHFSNYAYLNGLGGGLGRLISGGGPVRELPGFPGIPVRRPKLGSGAPNDMAINTKNKAKIPKMLFIV